MRLKGALYMPDAMPLFCDAGIGQEEEGLGLFRRVCVKKKPICFADLVVK